MLTSKLSLHYLCHHVPSAVVCWLLNVVGLHKSESKNTQNECSSYSLLSDVVGAWPCNVAKYRKALKPRLLTEGLSLLTHA